MSQRTKGLAVLFISGVVGWCMPLIITIPVAAILGIVFEDEVMSIV